MSTLERVIEIAVDAHRGQVDKGGQPYILHPLRVMLRLPDDPTLRITALLHDVVEDSAWTLEALAAEGFVPAVLEALAALTKQPGEDRLSAARRAATLPVARAVKLADNAENSDLGRIPHPSARDHARLAEYHEVRRILEDAAGPTSSTGVGAPALDDGRPRAEVTPLVAASARALDRGEVPAWIRAHLDAYRESGGREGHLWDSTAVGGNGPQPCLLLTTLGRRSGRTHTHPLLYGRDGEAYIIVGSKGGSDSHPAWYHNLLAQPLVELQVGGERFRARAELAVGAHRDRLWRIITTQFPPYADYQARTPREIPLFALTRLP